MKMITTAMWVARIKEYKNWSDYRLAKEFGVATSAAYRWRDGKSVMRDNHGAKAAQILGLKPELIKVHLDTERAYVAEDQAKADLLKQFVDSLKEKDFKAAIMLLALSPALPALAPYIQ